MYESGRGEIDNEMSRGAKGNISILSRGETSWGGHAQRSTQTYMPAPVLLQKQIDFIADDKQIQIHDDSPGSTSALNRL